MSAPHALPDDDLDAPNAGVYIPWLTILFTERFKVLLDEDVFDTRASGPLPLPTHPTVATIMNVFANSRAATRAITKTLSSFPALDNNEDDGNHNNNSQDASSDHSNKDRDNSDPAVSVSNSTSPSRVTRTRSRATESNSSSSSSSNTSSTSASASASASSSSASATADDADFNAATATANDTVAAAENAAPGSAQSPMNSLVSQMSKRALDGAAQGLSASLATGVLLSFDRYLPRFLLIETERRAFFNICHASGARPSDCYGVEHLLRLLSVLPALTPPLPLSDREQQEQRRRLANLPFPALQQGLSASSLSSSSSSSSANSTTTANNNTCLLLSGLTAPVGGLSFEHGLTSTQAAALVNAWFAALVLWLDTNQSSLSDTTPSTSTLATETPDTAEAAARDSSDTAANARSRPPNNNSNKSGSLSNSAAAGPAADAPGATATAIAAALLEKNQRTRDSGGCVRLHLREIVKIARAMYYNACSTAPQFAPATSGSRRGRARATANNAGSDSDADADAADGAAEVVDTSAAADADAEMSPSAANASAADAAAKIEPTPKSAAAATAKTDSSVKTDASSGSTGPEGEREHRHIVRGHAVTVRAAMAATSLQSFIISALAKRAPASVGAKTKSSGNNNGSAEAEAMKDDDNDDDASAAAAAAGTDKENAENADKNKALHRKVRLPSGTY